MHLLRHASEVSAFIQTQPESEISALIQRRLAELLADGDTMEELVFFVIPEADDSFAELEDILCHPTLTLDGHPLWEVIEAHDGCYELVFVLSSSGYGALVLVPHLSAHPGTAARTRGSMKSLRSATHSAPRAQSRALRQVAAASSASRWVEPDADGDLSDQDCGQGSALSKNVGALAHG